MEKVTGAVSVGSAKQVAAVLKTFAFGDVYEAAIGRSGPAFREYVSLLTAAQDGVEEGCTIYPAMVFCDWCEERGLRAETVAGLRAVLNGLLVNPRPAGEPMLRAGE